VSAPEQGEAVERVGGGGLDSRLADGANGATSPGLDEAVDVAMPAAASILVVDDKPQNLLAMTQMLEGIGEDIIRVTSGADALRCLLRRDVAIILLDVQMPDMDGYELATLIRRRERSRHTPIIFITAYGRDDEDVSRGYALGAVDYVFKPVDPMILKAKVSVFVELFKKTEAARVQATLERRLQLENLRVRTEIVEAERALRQSEERQSLIVRSLPIALYTADPRNRFAGPRFLSESIANTVGFAAASFVDDVDLWTSRIHPADLPRVLSQAAAAIESGTLAAEYRWRCADGAERIFLDQAVLVRDDDGVPRELLGTCLDVTYRRQLERQLSHSQKMEALGQLTGGIAHDFNNMLSVIIWNLDLMVRSLKGADKTYDRAQNALSAALNCAELVRQLLTFARHQPHQAKAIDLSEVVPRMVRLLGPVVGERVRLDIRLADRLWPILADPAQVESAILNLAINARDAMPDGGTLTIEGVNARQGDILGSTPGDYVMLAITDTGIGISQEILDRVFEPFFTTKEVGKGSGLGLSMVYGFAKQSDGHVKIESTVGVGTTVRLYLPRTELPLDVREATSAEDGLPDVGGRTILVVEDNAGVRGMTVARLAELGYRVLEADGVATALDILTATSPVDVLFTDVVMPGGMSGLDLARRARELRPTIKVVFASGYASTFPTTGDETGELLQKPYRDEDLNRALRRALSGPAAEPPSIVEIGTSSVAAGS
jgi:PAS domain S-box-containing protein